MSPNMYSDTAMMVAPSPRRASTGGGVAAVAGLVQVLGNPFPRGYGSDEDEDDDEAEQRLIVQQQQLQQCHRRSSFSGGPIAHRRGSANGMTNGYHSSDNHVVATRRPSKSGGGVARSYSHDGGTLAMGDNPRFVPPHGPTRGGRRPSRSGNASGGGGLNAEVVERMSFRNLNTDAHDYGNTNPIPDDDDDDEEENARLYGYGASGYASNTGSIDASNPYGYQISSSSGNARKAPERRPSNASSVRSRSSRVSRRRSSNGITALRASHVPDPLAAAGLYPPPQRGHSLHVGATTTTSGQRLKKRHSNIYDSDPDDLEEPSSNSEMDDAGIGLPLPPNNGSHKKHNHNSHHASSNFGYDSDVVSDSDNSHASISSSKRLRRRNSCLVRPESDVALNLLGPTISSSMSSSRMSDRDLVNAAIGIEVSDEDDPDSLLNRAKKGSLQKAKSFGAGNNHRSGASASAAKSYSTTNATMRDSQEATDAEDNALLYEEYKTSKAAATTATIVATPATNSRVLGADPTPSNTAVAASISKDPTNTAANVMAATVATTTGSSATPATTKDKAKQAQTESSSQVAPIDSQSQRSDTKWRKSPFTVPYAAPTAENLRMSMMNMLTSTDHEPRTSTPNANANGAGIPGWGEMDIHGIDDGSSSPESSLKDKSDSEQSYGASMYTTPQVQQQEIDSYQQKARRRASLENTCVDIDNYVNGAKTQSVQNVKVPNFKPAEGCRNASDFVVRCFSARMRISGFVVLKHNRSRWSKAKNREIFLLPDCKTLTWREIDLEKEANGGGGPGGTTGMGAASNEGGSRTSTGKDKTRRPKIDLSSCIEIRHAWSADPLTKNKTGTAVLRSRCKEAMASKSFSLIFAKRTLDFTAFSNDQCKVLMEGFSALCFRLQLKALEDRNSDDHSSRSRMHLSEDDWVSTVYGESTAESASLTNTNSSIPVASTPWGC